MFVYRNILILLTSMSIGLSGCTQKQSRSSQTDKGSVSRSNQEVPASDDTSALIVPSRSSVIYAKGLTIIPIEFISTELIIAECSVMPSLPQGMSIIVSEGVCQIVGQPLETSPEKKYSITLISTTGSVHTLTITMIVRIGIPPVLDEEIPPVNYVSTVAGDPLEFNNEGDEIVSCQVQPSLPEGLILEVYNGSCRITGAATESRDGTDYTITATSIDGSQDSITVNITVVAANPPMLSGGGIQNFVTTVGIESLAFDNSGAPVTSCSVSPPLPDGLSFDTETCEISGTPNSAQVSTVYTITASAADGSQSVVTITIAVLMANPPQLESIVGFLEYDSGEEIDNVVFVNSGATVISCSSSPPLPTGLVLTVVSGTCRLSGTPTAYQETTLHVITAVASDGSKDTATISIKVNSDESVAFQLTGYANVDYDLGAPWDPDNESTCDCSLAGNPCTCRNGGESGIFFFKCPAGHIIKDIETKYILSPGWFMEEDLNNCPLYPSIYECSCTYANRVRGTTEEEPNPESFTCYNARQLTGWSWSNPCYDHDNQKWRSECTMELSNWTCGDTIMGCGKAMIAKLTCELDSP